HLARRLHQLGRLLPHRDRVQVDDAVDAVMRVLQLHEAADRAEIVAEMEVAGRLDAGEDERLEHSAFPGLWRAVLVVAVMATRPKVRTRAYGRGAPADQERCMDR